MMPVVRTLWQRISEDRAYRRWLINHGTIEENPKRRYRSEIGTFALKPLISIVLPVYNVEESLLRKCVASVTSQIYPHWELCIADDASTTPYVRPLLEGLAAGDDRIKVVFREVNGHISAASNTALDQVTGEFVVLLDHDDELSPDALFWVAAEINACPDTMMIYSDEDLIDPAGRRSGPKFKPDFSRDLFYSINLVTHLSAYRTEVLRDIGGFRAGFEGSQDYDLALRVIEQIREDQIRHIPRILYHWRKTPGSLAHDLEAKPYAHQRARAAIREHLERIGKQAEVCETGYLHRVRYRLPEPQPPVRIIVKTGSEADIRASVDLIRSKTAYEALDIVAAPARVDLSAAANLNELALSGSTDLICFIDAELEPLSPAWLTEMTAFAVQTEIGAVGAKLLYSNNTIAGNGCIIGAGDLVAQAHEGFLKDAPSNLSRNRLASNYSAVTVECMLIRRSVFEALGGFDAEDLPGALFDVDLCLRIGETGLRIVVTPFAELRWRRSRGKTERSLGEENYFRGRWERVLRRDPFYNPNLSRADARFFIDA